MVLDSGQIVSTALIDDILLNRVSQVQYGSPRDLLRDHNGAFRALVDSSADKEQLLSRVAI
jgi:hypothetical protein